MLGLTRQFYANFKVTGKETYPPLVNNQCASREELRQARRALGI